MKKNKRLNLVIEQAVKISFKDGKLREIQVKKLVNTFKQLRQTEAIYVISGYLTGLKSELAKHTLIVESAIPLTSPELRQIKKRLSIHYHLTLTHSVENPALLGGIRARVDDCVYDLSLKGKLEQVKEAIHG